MITLEELKRLAIVNIGEGVVESWGTQADTENENVLKLHVDGLLLAGYVIITPTEKDKYYHVEFQNDNGETVSTHTTSRNNLPKLIDAHVERAKEWSDDEYKRRHMERAKASGIDDIYNAMEMLRDGDVKHVMLFNQDGTPLECTNDGQYMTVVNTQTGEIMYKMEIQK